MHHISSFSESEPIGLIGSSGVWSGFRKSWSDALIHSFSGSYYQERKVIFPPNFFLLEQSLFLEISMTVTIFQARAKNKPVEPQPQPTSNIRSLRLAFTPLTAKSKKGGTKHGLYNLWRSHSSLRANHSKVLPARYYFYFSYSVTPNHRVALKPSKLWV